MGRENDTACFQFKATVEVTVYMNSIDCFILPEKDSYNY